MLVIVDVDPVGAVGDVPRVRSLAGVILRIRFTEQSSHVPRRHGETSRLLLRVHLVDIALGRCLSAPHCWRCVVVCTSDTVSFFPAYNGQTEVLPDWTIYAPLRWTKARQGSLTGGTRAPAAPVTAPDTILPICDATVSTPPISALLATGNAPGAPKLLRWRFCLYCEKWHPRLTLVLN